MPALAGTARTRAPCRNRAPAASGPDPAIPAGTLQLDPASGPRQPTCSAPPAPDPHQAPSTGRSPPASPSAGLHVAGYRGERATELRRRPGVDTTSASRQCRGARQVFAQQHARLKAARDPLRRRGFRGAYPGLCPAPAEPSVTRNLVRCRSRLSDLDFVGYSGRTWMGAASQKYFPKASGRFVRTNTDFTAPCRRPSLAQPQAFQWRFK